MEFVNNKTATPCEKLTLQEDGVDGEAFMYSHCYDFCAKSCRYPHVQRGGGADMPNKTKAAAHYKPPCACAMARNS